MGINCSKSITYDNEGDFKINDFLNFCIDKKVSDMNKIANQNGYFTRAIHYNERGLETEEFILNRINFYTYKYNNNYIEYATNS